MTSFLRISDMDINEQDGGGSDDDGQVRKGCCVRMLQPPNRCCPPISRAASICCACCHLFVPNYALCKQARPAAADVFVVVPVAPHLHQLYALDVVRPEAGCVRRVVCGGREDVSV